MRAQNKTLQGISYFLLAIAVLVSINIAYRRVQFEDSRKSVDLIVSYKDMKQLSLLGGMEIKPLLEILNKKTRITSIAIEEDTLEDFINSGKVSMLKGSEVMNMYRVGHVNRFLLTHLYKKIKVKPERFYLIIEEKADYERIRDFLMIEFGKDSVKRIGQLNILEVIDDKEDLLQIGLGISRNTISQVRKLGFQPVIRLKNSNRLSQALIRQKFLSFAEELKHTTVIFEGDSVLGYPSQLSLTLEKLNAFEYNIGFVEFSKQSGITKMANSLPKQVVRVHSISSEEMGRYTPENASKRFYRAVKERGIRSIFIQSFKDIYQEGSIVDFNVKYFNKISTLIDKEGFTLTPREAFEIIDYEPAKTWELFIINCGVLALVLILFQLFFILRVGWAILTSLFFVGGFYVSFLFSSLMGWASFIALISAVVTPTIAVIAPFPDEEENKLVSNRILNALFYLLKVLGVCLMGAVMIVGLLSVVDYIFAIKRFMGVKISFIMPLVLIGIYFFLRPHRMSSIIFVFRRIFYAPIRTAGLASIVVLFGFVVVLILRSGNYFMMPSMIFEEKFRTMLESLLYVRPRTKEFLIGYPFLFLALVYLDKKISRHWVWFFMIIGVVAPISLVNSFCHIHTPLSISLYRSCLGIVLGFGFGAVYYFLYKLGEILLKRNHNDRN
ncbi:hypothetical protein DID80_03465 [Candidatus Marinamargulisbacteria bacterium SCGC AAA071-K20]|nr:hypothetical protein DID80_03465 [Candidatus Marinamargulisbacteria bacterium SCGC AAA071-K20]